ncbi:peptide/nickel transport system substrate-binding protein [Pseudonocardia kunmingensis]|uniref:Peptide/nickel transport system substrate-binding protein n=1 Tax=Pseudonocardia kunmingensis TaxID=630975 RepID=A0A543DP55_9PSEU|nr:peptide/nickel transport system substrate-binding protein [Pseudonocardia kunmingensis]
MRHHSLAVIAFVVGLGLAACSSPATDTAPAAPTPVCGGTLVVAIDSDPGSLNPAATTSGGVHTASELMFNGLVGLGPDLQPVPELAESWEVLEDGALYRFHLREGVTWHDGQPFTSGDVKYSFEEVLLKLHSRTQASVGSAIQSIAASDPSTVEFRFKQPYAPLLQQLDVTEAPIVPQHLYQGTDPAKNPANMAPIGTGPYTFVSYAPGSEIRMARNGSYFEAGLPYLDEVVMRVIPDRASQVNALRGGEVDWLFGVPGPERAVLEADPAFGTLQTPINPGGSNCIMTVSFNLDRPVLQDLRVRQAISFALDRQQFVDRVLFGEGRAADAPISSGIPFAYADDLDNVVSYDPAQAERLLDEAGWKRSGDGGVRSSSGVQGVPDGTPLAINFVAFPSFNQYAELYRAQLAAVGIDVTLQPLDPPVFADTVFAQRNFDTNIISYCNGTDPEIGVKRMFLSSNISKTPFSNASAYRNPQMDALFGEAATTVDPAQRSEVYRQIQQLAVDDAPYTWVVETTATRVFRSGCEGFGPSGHFAKTAFCAPPQ